MLGFVNTFVVIDHLARVATQSDAQFDQGVVPYRSPQCSAFPETQHQPSRNLGILQHGEELPPVIT